MGSKRAREGASFQGPGGQAVFGVEVHDEGTAAGQDGRERPGRRAVDDHLGGRGRVALVEPGIRDSGRGLAVRAEEVREREGHVVSLLRQAILDRAEYPSRRLRLAEERREAAEEGDAPAR